MNKIDPNTSYMRSLPDLWKFHQYLCEMNMLLNHNIEIEDRGFNEFIASRDPKFHNQICKMKNELWAPLRCEQLQELIIKKKYDELADHFRTPVSRMINQWNEYVEEYEKKETQS